MKTECHGNPADRIADPKMTPTEHRELKKHIKNCEACQGVFNSRLSLQEDNDIWDAVESDTRKVLDFDRAHPTAR